MPRKTFTPSEHDARAAEEIRKIRSKAGLSLEQMAVKLGVSVRSLSRYEMQQRAISSSLLELARDIGQIAEGRSYADRQSPFKYPLTPLSEKIAVHILSREKDKQASATVTLDVDTVLAPNAFVRPDAILRLGTGRFAVIDSRGPIAEFITYAKLRDRTEVSDAKGATEAERQALARTSHEELSRAQDTLTRGLNEYVQMLSHAAYRKQFKSLPAFTVAYFPSDDFCAFAADVETPASGQGDTPLWIAAWRARILFASPESLDNILLAATWTASAPRET